MGGGGSESKNLYLDHGKTNPGTIHSSDQVMLVWELVVSTAFFGRAALMTSTIGSAHGAIARHLCSITPSTTSLLKSSMRCG